jgi:hypothetical protein
MSGAIPSLPNTPSWRGAQIKKAQGQLYLYVLPLSTQSGNFWRQPPIFHHNGYKLKVCMV